MIKRLESFLEYYLKFFGDQTDMSVELFPETHEPEDPGPHGSLEAVYAANQAVDSKKRYNHTCWCNPELIYADDTRGNEVWLHKRVQ